MALLTLSTPRTPSTLLLLHLKDGDDEVGGDSDDEVGGDSDDDGNDASVKPKQESKPMLTPETLKKMITAIQEGKSDKVKEAMENYTISGPQSNVLKLALINV